MRTSIRAVTLWLGIGILAAAHSAVAQTPDTRPGIAVMPFTNGGSIGPNREDLAAWEVGLQQQMITELSYNPALRLVERSRLREILQESERTRSGQVNPQTAAQIGRLVGARYMILPAFMDNAGTMWMSARIVNVETGETLPRAEQVRGRRDNVYDLVVDLSAQITRSARLPAIASNVQAERKRRALPSEALTLYSKALALQDDGETEEAIELYRMISQQFPQMTEAREALRQLTDMTE
jgi:TolB-like protein